jgi:predicted O-methyltransferase YrrM
MPFQQPPNQLEPPNNPESPADAIQAQDTPFNKGQRGGASMEAEAGTLEKAAHAEKTVTGKSGASHTVHSAIDGEEERFLEQTIAADPSIRRTLEVGCAYGIASLRICNALRGRARASHTILDPYQTSQWDGAGIRSLEEAGIVFFKLLEERSEYALPNLAENDPESYDLIFIDGWHTLDHTLVDCFYATRLLRTGGYLVVDDILLPPVRRVMDYLSHYPCYRIKGFVSGPENPTFKLRLVHWLGSIFPILKKTGLLHPDLRHRLFGVRTNRMVALQKVGPDNRPWDWYRLGI